MSRILQRKTAPCRRGKEALAETEEELVLKIPLIARLRPIVIEPQTILIALDLEDVRVPVGVGSAWHAIWSTAHRRTIGLYFTYDRESTSAPHQVIPFLKEHRAHPPRKTLVVRALNLHVTAWS